MNTVVKLPEFIRRADKLLHDAEREELIRHLAAKRAEKMKPDNSLFV